MLVLCIHFRQCSESEQHLTLSMEATKSSGRSAFFSLTTQKLYRIFSKIDRPIPNIRTCLPTISQVFLYGLLLYMPSYSIYSYTINKWISISRIWCNVYTLLSRNKASNVSRENRERESVFEWLFPLFAARLLPTIVTEYATILIWFIYSPYTTQQSITKYA